MWLYQGQEKLWLEHKACKFDPEFKVNVVFGSWIYKTNRLMVIDHCVKYGMQMLKQKDENLHICTDRQSKSDSYIPPPPIPSAYSI